MAFSVAKPDLSTSSSEKTSSTSWLMWLCAEARRRPWATSHMHALAKPTGQGYWAIQAARAVRELVRVLGLRLWLRCRAKLLLRAHNLGEPVEANHPVVADRLDPARNAIRNISHPPPTYLPIVCC